MKYNLLLAKEYFQRGQFVQSKAHYLRNLDLWTSLYGMYCEPLLENYRKKMKISKTNHLLVASLIGLFYCGVKMGSLSTIKETYLLIKWISPLVGDGHLVAILSYYIRLYETRLCPFEELQEEIFRALERTFYSYDKHQYYDQVSEASEEEYQNSHNKNKTNKYYSVPNERPGRRAGSQNRSKRSDRPISSNLPYHQKIRDDQLTSLLSTIKPRKPNSYEKSNNFISTAKKSTLSSASKKSPQEAIHLAISSFNTDNTQEIKLENSMILAEPHHTSQSPGKFIRYESINFSLEEIPELPSAPQQAVTELPAKLEKSYTQGSRMIPNLVQGANQMGKHKTFQSLIAGKSHRGKVERDLASITLDSLNEPCLSYDEAINKTDSLLNKSNQDALEIRNVVSGMRAREVIHDAIHITPPNEILQKERDIGIAWKVFIADLV
jgi:hypothetical protein